MEVLVLFGLFVLFCIFVLSNKKKTNNNNNNNNASRRKNLHPALIRNNFETLNQVSAALKTAGLESCNLIVGVDFTASNDWTGKESFGGHCLHALFPPNETRPNPYEEVLSTIGKTLSFLDDDGLVPAYGFGTADTGAHSVFSFVEGDKPCVGLDGVLAAYRSIVPAANMAGPTSFAPVINQAVEVVARSGGGFHVLCLVADGQITRPVNSSARSRYEQETIDAIVHASNFPLGIIMVGVGDGPFDLMEEFDDELPERNWDNFQFVRFTSGMDPAKFALQALQELPEQYNASLTLSRVDHNYRAVGVKCLPPPSTSGSRAGAGAGSGVQDPR